MTGDRKRLLFADDEPSIRATLPIILQRYGFDVTVAATIPEAVQQIKEKTFDLLLCDLNFQTTDDGYTIVRAMRQANPNCVVIILTGYPELDSAIEGIHEQVDDYIVKPTDADSLVATLAEKLAARRKLNSPEPA